MSIKRIRWFRQVLSLIACAACLYTTWMYWSMVREQAVGFVSENVYPENSYIPLVVYAEPSEMNWSQARNIFQPSLKISSEQNTAVAQVRQTFPSNVRIVARVRDHIEEVVLEDGRNNTVLLLRPDEPQGDFTLKHISEDQVEILYRGELYQLRIPHAS